MIRASRILIASTLAILIGIFAAAAGLAPIVAISAGAVAGGAVIAALGAGRISDSLQPRGRADFTAFAGALSLVTSIGLVVGFIGLTLATWMTIRTNNLRTHELGADAVNPHLSSPKYSLIIMGTEINSDGVIPSAKQRHRFRPGESIYLTILTSEPSVVRVIWHAPHGEVSDRKRTSQVVERVIFQAPDTSSWPSNDYRVDVFLNNTTAVLHFTVTSNR
jgi:hypothetical protein